MYQKQKIMKTVKVSQINDTHFYMNDIPEKETDKAIFVRVMNDKCGSNFCFWLPKSQVKQQGDRFIMPSWLVEKSFQSIK
jgi:hypothetical protein